jgi:transcription elongation factor
MSGMRNNRKTIAAGAGAAGLLGLGLYFSVPAFADDPAPSPSPTAHAGKGHPGKGHPLRRARALRGVHGEATVKRKDGFHLATWQRGKVTAVSATGVTVRSDDGVSWTWTSDGKTHVRKNGEKSSLKGLAGGDQVLVAGERSGGTRTARVIRVPRDR